MKCYTHFQPPQSTPDDDEALCTCVLNIEDPGSFTLKDLVEASVEKLQLRSSTRQDEGWREAFLSPSALNLGVRLQDGRRILPSRLSGIKVMEEIEDGGDVTIFLHSSPPPRPLHVVEPLASSTAASSLAAPIAASIASEGSSKGTPPPPPSRKDKQLQKMEEGEGKKGKGPASTTSKSLLLLNQLMQAAGSYQKAGNLRGARAIYKQILSSIDPVHRPSRLGLGQVAYQNQKWKEALSWLRPALEEKQDDDEEEEEGRSTCSGRQDDDDDEKRSTSSSKDEAAAAVEEWYMLGRAYTGVAEHQKALQCYTKAKVRLRISADGRDGGEGGGGIEKIEKREEETSSMTMTRRRRITEDDLVVAMGTSTFDLGQVEEAVNFLNSVLHHNAKHVGAIVECARLTYRVGNFEDSLSYLLQAIVLDQKNKEAKKEMARALGLEGGVDRLKKMVPSTPSAAAAYAFLGTIAKDGGEIDASIAIYKEAVRQAPSCSSYALNLAHVYEVHNLYQKAYKTLKSHLVYRSKQPPSTATTTKSSSSSNSSGKNDTTSIGSSSSGATSNSNSSSLLPPPLASCCHQVLQIISPLTQILLPSHNTAASCCHQVIQIISPLTQIPRPIANTEGGSPCTSSMSWVQGEDSYILFTDQEGSSEKTSGPITSTTRDQSTSSTSSTSSSSNQRRTDGIEKEKEEMEKLAYDSSSTSSSSSSNKETKLIEKKEMKKIAYDEAALDLLALLFTLVKILFLKGQLIYLPPLLQVIEPLRRASVTKLHRTTIRNEHAYYCCIAQLLCISFQDRIASSSSTTKPIYVCGDSHTLSPAWMSIQEHGQSRQLYPALVTGLKHWHLRPESTFYPKKNFYYVMEDTGGIPERAEVIFLFGEIDCREGILVAVEKCRYEDVEEGIHTTVNIFIQAALELVKRKKFKAYIHPIIPVLNETRKMVKAYNQVLQQAVQNTNGVLHWLDFFHALLSEDQQGLREGLELDGTHLHPIYLKYLAPALEKAIQE